MLESHGTRASPFERPIVQIGDWKRDRECQKRNAHQAMDDLCLDAPAAPQIAPSRVPFFFSLSPRTQAQCATLVAAAFSMMRVLEKYIFLSLSKSILKFQVGDFLVRCVVDEALPPAYLVDRVFCALGGEIVKKACRLLRGAGVCIRIFFFNFGV